jgi:hypothetical protein
MDKYGVFFISFVWLGWLALALVLVLVLGLGFGLWLGRRKGI